MNARFNSLLAPTIRRYLALKHALGRQYAGVERILVHLDRFLSARSVDLGAQTFAEWCLTFRHLAPTCRRNRMREIRNLCRYRRRREPGCFVPDDRLFPSVHQAIRPHLFTPDQVGQLLAAAHTLARTANSPLCPETIRLAIVLLYTTGMRRRELTRLTVGDYDLRERTLLIRKSKFYKSRLIPVSADAACEIVHLITLRRQRRFPTNADSPLLWHRNRGYTGGGIGIAIRVLLRRAGIRTTTGRVPRTHDFRHAFAAQVLLRWYRTGVDVGSKLPYLAHYLGHVSIVSTAYYLQFVEPLAAEASARFAGHCGRLITPAALGGGQ
jgi:integrase/recombinase XerD